ncbi:l-lactate dehydrogenase [Ceraceosorus bombacis]|uniref:L-lactate dehydrogenase n=1 Tax=Ceraceosorus bombacis TaxID=401625 RepID=A0A0P1B9T5_9BASI|nr:l-lactate dehydrogenase [Ceraceosorus bombacis]
MDASNLPARRTPHWALYQKECFLLPSQKGHLPPFNTHPVHLESLAKDRLSAGGWSYAHSNAGMDKTHDANREAFDRWKIVPRMLVDTTHRDTTVELFGKTLSAPIGLSPIGLNKIYHPLGELPVAKVAGELGLPYSLSTAGSQSIEDCALHNAHGASLGHSRSLGAQHAQGLKYYQLYLPHDQQLTRSLLQRAHEANYDACIMTLDTDQLAWRHDDVALSNYAPYRSGTGAEIGLSDPVFQKRLQEAGIDAKKQPEKAGEKWIDTVWHGRPHDWSVIPSVLDMWRSITSSSGSCSKPLLLKGIQSGQDAQKALDLGVDGIVVSNHAGRQVDGAMASLDALPEVVRAVKGKIPILFDSGIRTAADIFKALALGADCVMIGRVWVYALSIEGETGVRHVLRSLLAELDILLNVAGYPTIKSITRSAIKSREEIAQKL